MTTNTSTEIAELAQFIGSVLDEVSEALPTEDRARFAAAVTEAIPVGADLSPVLNQWILDILADEEQGVWRHTAGGSAQRAAVDAVVALYRRRLAGDEPTRDEWLTARSNAYVTARDAAARNTYGDAYASVAAADAISAAAAGTESGAAAYAAAVADDADAAVAYAGGSAARKAARRWQATRLIHHITTAHITTVIDA